MLRREVTVHIAFAELQTFSPVSVANVLPPIQLAFYDSLRGGIGHYKAIVWPRDSFSYDLNGERR